MSDRLAAAAPRAPLLAGPGTALFLFVAAIAALAPLPLGAARPLAWDVLALAVALALLWSVLRPPAGAAELRPDILPAVLLFLGVVVWILLQTALFTPAAWHSPVWREAGAALRRHLAGSIAVDRRAPFVGLLRLLAYAGMFYLALRLGGEPRRARAAIAVIAFSGSAYAAYALAVFWSGNTHVLWLAKVYYRADLTGTFVNRNHFATYLGIVLLAVLCRLLDGFKDLRLDGGWRSRLALSVEFLGRRVWLVVSPFLVATALLLTHSRGGFIAAAAGLLALGAALLLSRGPGRARAGLLAGAALLALLAVAISGGPTMARLLGTDVDAEERLAVWRLVVQAIGQHFWAGTGLGSFPLVFPSYRTAAVVNLYDRAHNDYLENLLELGVPAAAALFAALFWLAGLCLRGAARRRRGAMFPALGFAASALAGVHSLTDFSLQIPAVTTVWMFLLGVGVAQSRSSRAAISGPPPAPPRSRAAMPDPTRTPR